MSVIISNILQLLAVGAAYFALFALIPFWLRGYRLSADRVMDDLIGSFLYMHIIVMLLVVLLSLAHIYSRFTLILFLLLVAAAYRCLFRRKKTFDGFRGLYRNLHWMVDGYYPPRLLLKILGQKLSCFLSAMRRKLPRPASLVLPLMIFGYGAYVRCYHAVTNLFYGSSDMYLHTEWIKMLMYNRPYLAGVYPLGFHAVITAIADVFGINVVTVMRMMGSVFGMLMLLSLYYLLRRTMRSAFAANFAMAAFVVAGLFPFWAMERQYLTLPQEFGTIFLYLAAYFLYQYMRTKALRDLISFAATVSLTLMTHFFIALFAVLLCGAVFIGNLVYVRKQMFFRLVIAVLLAVLLAVMPLVCGLMKSIPFNASMEWALSYFMATGQDEGLGVVDAMQKQKPEVTGASIVRELDKRGQFNPGEPLDRLWLVPYLAAAGLGIVTPVFRRKDGERPWIFLGLSLYTLLLLILFVFSLLEIFAIMECSRLYAFFIYSVPLVLGFPFEVLYMLLYETGKKARALYCAIVCAAGALASGWIWQTGRFMPLGRIWQAQYSGAVRAYYDILAECPRYGWTVVSSMTEYSQCLFEGYHFHMAEFIRAMDQGDRSLTLTTEDVFFFVVKRPNYYLDSDLQRLGSFEPLPAYNPADASLDLTEAYAGDMLRIYQDRVYNSILQAKAAAWAEEYRKYYPNEMTVFYEDDEIVVYRIRQNAYAPNQFVIPYAGSVGNRSGGTGQRMLLLKE